MGSVYLAQIRGERGFERWVAVKVVDGSRVRDATFMMMFGDEARLIGRIHHPHVCSVIDFGREGELLYLVMEYLHGEALSALLRRSWAEDHSFPAWLAARAIADAARGLHAAHELTDAHGEPLELVHRDVSPENLLVSYDGPTKVIDFGVVRARGRQTKTADGLVKGKLSYMAPEQLRSRGVDRRADVWSLGVVLWEATLGRRLFRGDTQIQTIERVCDLPIRLPSEITEHYPADLEQIVMAALSRDPERRTPSAKVLAHQLESYLHKLGRPIGHAQVASWMHEHFSDRLLVREALLVSPEDSGPIHLGPLGEQSDSAIHGGVIRSTSFAPPPEEQPTGITRVGALRAMREEPLAETMVETIDASVDEIRRQERRRGGVLWVLLAVLVAIGVAAYLWLRSLG